MLLTTLLQASAEEIATTVEEVAPEASYSLLGMASKGGWLMIVLVILSIILPLIWLIYGGIKMIFGFKSPKWRPGLVIFVLWLIVLVVVGVLFALGAISTEYLTV